MNKKALCEITEQYAGIVEEREDGGKKSMTVEVRFSRADTINQNQRLYPRKVLQREIDRLLPAMKAGKVFGCAFHPEKGTTEIPEVSHMIQSAWLEPSGEAKALVKILPTRSGSDLMTIIRNGGCIGLSTRGSGTTIPKKVEGKGAGYEEIADDYKLSAVDFVVAGSFSDAGVLRLIEQRLEKGGLTDAEAIAQSDILWDSLLDMARQSGWAGTMRQFQELYLGGPDAELAEEYARAKQAGFRGDFAAYAKVQRKE